MKLVLGWTIVGAFCFTTAISCLSLIGWVRFADRRQQRKLFATLVCEVVVLGGAQLSGMASLDPSTIQNLVDVGVTATVEQLLDDDIAPDDDNAPLRYLSTATAQRTRPILAKLKTGDGRPERAGFRTATKSLERVHVDLTKAVRAPR